MQTITFSEQLLFQVNPTYVCKTETISFIGEIVTDASTPTSPVIAFDQGYMGPVTFSFSLPVQRLSLTAGFFNAEQTTIVKVFDSNGTLIGSRANRGTGIDSFNFRHDDIASVTIKTIGSVTDPSGFAVDNVAFTLTPPEVGPSGDADIDGLLSGYKWENPTITFSFPLGAQDYLFNGYQSAPSFQPLTDAQQAAVRAIMAGIGAVSGLTVLESGAPNATLRFGQASGIDTSDGNGLTSVSSGLAPGRGIGPSPDAAPVSWGDVWLDGPKLTGTSDFGAGGFLFSAALMRQVGRSLGLREAGSRLREHGEEFAALPGRHDRLDFTVMASNSHAGGTPADPTGFDFPTTFMQNDIAALQEIYGADFGAEAGDSVYTWDAVTGEMAIDGDGQGAPGRPLIYMTVWDGGGNDTYDFSAWTEAVRVTLAPGAFSTVSATLLADLGDGRSAVGNIANALLFRGDLRSLIENATGGSGNDTLAGNTGNNALSGSAGNDLLNATAGGDDRLFGGSGDDTVTFRDALTASDRVFGGSGFDVATLDGDYGAGVVFSEATMRGIEAVLLGRGSNYRLTTADGTVAAGEVLTIDSTALRGVDRLTFRGGAETDGAFDLRGGVGGDRLVAGAGDDSLRGGRGGDTLSGGLGADTFIAELPEESTGPDRDVIAGFDAAADVFDLGVSVTGIDPRVTRGRLNETSFDADLAAAISSTRLSADHALIFTASRGDLAGSSFVIVDVNAVAGYQAGEDFVFEVTGGRHFGDFGLANFI